MVPIPAILLAAFVCILIPGVYLWITGVGTSSRYANAGDDVERPKRIVSGMLTTLVGLGGTIAVFALWTSLYFSTLGGVNDLAAFHDSTFPAYVYAIEQTEGVEIIASEPGLLDVAYIAQATEAAGRVEELRDQVEWYNSKLAKLRARQDTPLGIFMYHVPDRLEPIILTYGEVGQ